MVHIVDNHGMKNAKHWDIFCKVIDNFGDIGVCWRLCCDLASRGCQIRLWLDDTSALRWLAPNGHPGVHLIHWANGWSEGWQIQAPWPDVILEGFGCGPDPDYLRQWEVVGTGLADCKPPVWINLEYLSAEAYVERSHGLSSPTVQHAWLSQRKYFFYPGFTNQTGGLIRELQLGERRLQFDRSEFWSAFDPLKDTTPLNRRPLTRLSLFCYRNAPVQDLLEGLLALQAPSGQLLVCVTPGQAQEAADLARRQPALVRAKNAGDLRWLDLPFLTQTQFDALLWACDLNLVRGEDSLVRALWAQKPFLWHLYQQDDGRQFPKLEAFLEQTELPPDWAKWMRHWNHDHRFTFASGAQNPAPPQWRDWQAHAQHLSQRLETHADLGTRLLQFVAERQ
jgi:uncharacterized repeat protein (TIGR03837 family)